MAQTLCERIEILEQQLADLLAQPETIYFKMWAEENGALNVGAMEYSFGNGQSQNAIGLSNDWGIVMDYPYEVISGAIGMRLSNTADTAVQVTVNDVAVGPVITVPGGQTKVVDNSISYSGPAGDTLNFATVLNGGGNDVVPSILIKYTLP